MYMRIKQPDVLNCDHKRTETKWIRFNKVNTMDADALDLCIAKTSVPMIVTI